VIPATDWQDDAQPELPRRGKVADLQRADVDERGDQHHVRLLGPQKPDGSVEQRQTALERRQ
jgi:hypothetical protein